LLLRNSTEVSSEEEKFRSNSSSAHFRKVAETFDAQVTKKRNLNFIDSGSSSKRKMKKKNIKSIDSEASSILV
jgi:hypothetical protein